MKTIISPDKQTYSILSFSNFDSSFFFKSKIKKRLECLKKHFDGNDEGNNKGYLCQLYRETSLFNISAMEKKCIKLA